MKHLSMGLSSSVAGHLKLEGTSTLHRGDGKLLQSSMIANGEVGLSLHQARRKVTEMRRGTHNNYMDDLCKLPSLIENLQKADTHGYYKLHTKPLSYHVEGAPQNARELVGVTIISSAAKSFFSKSDGKILCVDMAHNHDKYPGVTAAAVARDGYNHNQMLFLARANTENKESWVNMTDELAEHFNANMIMADKAKGKIKVLFNVTLCSAML